MSLYPTSKKDTTGLKRLWVDMLISNYQIAMKKSLILATQIHYYHNQIESISNSTRKEELINPHLNYSKIQVNFSFQ